MDIFANMPNVQSMTLAHRSVSYHISRFGHKVQEIVYRVQYTWVQLQVGDKSRDEVIDQWDSLHSFTPIVTTDMCLWTQNSSSSQPATAVSAVHVADSD